MVWCNMYFVCVCPCLPAVPICTDVCGTVGSMSESFRAGKQEVSWVLLCSDSNCKPEILASSLVNNQMIKNH